MHKNYFRLICFLLLSMLFSNGMQAEENLQFRFIRQIEEAEDFIYKEVTTTQGGELAALLGEDANNIDSLVVLGPINNDDFTTMWSASFEGRLSAINLEHAHVEGGCIPNHAFFNSFAQLSEDMSVVYAIHLRRIILPDDIIGIDKFAFSYCINLENVNIPPKLQYVGMCAFSDCIKLHTEKMVFAEGLEKIGENAFFNCNCLSGAEVLLPSTIKEIGNSAFYNTGISSINLPEGLESLGMSTFYRCKLREITIPTSCVINEGYAMFMLNTELESIQLPEGLSQIHENFLAYCSNLKRVNIPSTVKKIDEYALIGTSSLEELSFPSSLEVIGEYSCNNMTNLKRIYCAAIEPPVCQRTGSAFGNSSTPVDIPIYVPVGSAEKYRTANGWNYFTNYVELDEFPGTTSISNIKANDRTSETYDLSGRRLLSPRNGVMYIKDGKLHLPR